MALGAPAAAKVPAAFRTRAKVSVDVCVWSAIHAGCVDVFPKRFLSGYFQCIPVSIQMRPIFQTNQMGMCLTWLNCCFTTLILSTFH